MDKKIRVLVADDDPTVGLLIPAALPVNEFDITLVADGRAALIAYIGNPAFDLLVLDVEMPEMNGLAVAEQIRSADSEIPLVLLTGRGDEAFLVACQRLRAQHLPKPVNWRSLAADLRAALHGG